jgi:hypothetical protein
VLRSRFKSGGNRNWPFFGETSRKAEPGAGNRDHIRLVEVKMLMWRGALVLLLWSLTASRGANILFFHNMGTKYAVQYTNLVKDTARNRL